MIKTHMTRAHENTSSTHDLHHMNEMHHNIQLIIVSLHLQDLSCIVDLILMVRFFHVVYIVGTT